MFVLTGFTEVVQQVKPVVCKFNPKRLLKTTRSTPWVTPDHILLSLVRAKYLEYQ